MSEAPEKLADKLFEDVRKHDPVPPQTIERVAERLSSRPQGLNLMNRARITGLCFASCVAFLLTINTSDNQVPLAPGPSLAAIKAPRVVINVPAPPEMTPAMPVSPAPPSLPKPRPVRRLEVVETAPTVKETPKSLEAPKALQRGSVLAWQSPLAPKMKRAPRKTYSPRAIVEFQQVDWERLKEEALPAYVQKIIHEQDRPALLAALDDFSVDTLDNRPQLLLVRAELRAGAARCKDALLDFERLIEGGSSDPIDPIRARALDGQALCRDAL